MDEKEVNVEELQEENERLKQSLQIERENNRILSDTVVRLSAKLVGVIQ